MGILSQLFGPPSLKNNQQRPHINNQEQSSQTNIIIFNVAKCQSEELVQCKLGDFVNLWIPKDNSQNVHIFRRGSVGGTGWIGYVPNKFSSLIARHLSCGLRCETEILEINVNQSLCKIRCSLFSQEETIAQQAADFKVSSDKLLTELQTKYTPRNQSLETKIQLPKNHNLEEGQEIFFENKPIDYYIQNATKLSVNFIDNKGIIVAQKSYDLKIIRTLLRAYFSKCSMKIRIKTIDKPGEYTLKYIEFIEATIQVSFS